MQKVLTAVLLVCLFACKSEPPMTGARYFELAITSITEADIEFQRVNELDKADASSEEITRTLDSCIARCNDGISAMNAPKPGELEFPLAAELQEKTVAWLQTMKKLCEQHLKPMTYALAQPEDVWSEEDFNAFFEYGKAYEEFQRIDADWVAFQEEYAAQNNLTFTGTIDMDELMEVQ